MCKSLLWWGGAGRIVTQVHDSTQYVHQVLYNGVSALSIISGRNSAAKTLFLRLPQRPSALTPSPHNHSPVSTKHLSSTLPPPPSKHQHRDSEYHCVVGQGPNQYNRNGDLAQSFQVMQSPRSQSSPDQAQQVCTSCKTRKRKCNKALPKCSSCSK